MPTNKIDTMSNAEIIKFAARELMETGEVVAVSKIKQHAERMSGKTFTSGMVSGALYSMMAGESDVYETVGRGKYQKVAKKYNPDQPTIDEAFNEVLKHALEELRAVGNRVTITMPKDEVDRFQDTYTRLYTTIDALLIPESDME